MRRGIWASGLARPGGGFPDRGLRRGIGRIVAFAGRAAAPATFARRAGMRRVRRAEPAADRRGWGQPDDRRRYGPAAFLAARSRGGRRGGRIDPARLILWIVSGMPGLALCSRRSDSENILAGLRRRSHVAANDAPARTAKNSGLLRLPGADFGTGCGGALSR